MEMPNYNNMEIVELVACGYSNAEIGDRLYLSEKMVTYYINNMLEKYQCRNRTSLVVKMVAFGFLDISKLKLAERPLNLDGEV